MDYDNLTDKDYREIDIMEWRNRIVKHFKGDLYLIVDVAEHTETGERMVIYKALYGDCKLYVRPMNMFIEKCTEEQFDKYGQEYRFEKVELASVKK